ncbi:hypothetical protein TAMA11512_15770 [Selenomonas sp. TAMA-11512]|uniref:ShlB/FhaC/HecB family hemolysin secretion/activation protein n=1 Tax=Selenomonas sp. TAMA-11512 TaxID=3095337 RepID=UPI0030908C36|nr:hypothetical protein TAMA11512_15770 [Selenomonas sp. TAMA-11512]
MKRTFFPLVLAVTTGVAFFLPQSALAAPSLSMPGEDIRQAAPRPKASVDRTGEDAPRTTGDTVFAVREIILDAKELKLSEKKIQAIMQDAIGDEMTLASLNEVLDRLTIYCRQNGYPATAAYLPEQESEAGVITIRIIPGRYGDVKIDNKSRLKDNIAQGFLAGLDPGKIIRTRDLETALYSISDMSGTRAVGMLRPGESFGTSDVVVQIEDGKMDNTVLYTENYGSKNSGRYRYGLQHSLYNVDGQGGKVNIGHLRSNENLRNSYVNYETLVGRGGTTLGLGYSRMDYHLGGAVRSLGATGKADTYTLYGSTPVYHTSNEKLTVTYGYDHRKLKDDLQLFGDDAAGKKHSDSAHVGVNGFTRNPHTGSAVDYALSLTVGELSSDSRYSEQLMKNAGTNGHYTKLEASATAVVPLGHKTDMVVKVSGQIADKNLDGSEEMYLGGANGVRAYPQGEGSGDEGIQGSIEFRYHTDVPGLLLSTYFDIGHVKFSHDGKSYGNGNGDTLKGWGIGLYYNMPGDWFARLDYARRIGLGRSVVDYDDSGRFWFLMGKIW